MNMKICAAVAAALAVSTQAFALDPTASNAATVKLNVTGASAARDAFGALMANTICASGFSVYRASPTTGRDFRAYSCTLSNHAELGTAANQTATVYYRAEGGSAWGPVPIAVGVNVKRLVIDGTCTTTTTLTISLPGVATAQQVYDCPVSAYDLDTDVSADTNLANFATDLGVADEEPKMYGPPNYPTSSAFSGTPVAQRQNAMNAVNGAASVGFGQTFAFIVNNNTGATGNGSAAVINSPFFGVSNPVLSRQTLAGIFNGAYTDWNQVPTVSGAKVTASSIKIRVCRREPGSGTQVAANQFTLSTPQCGTTLGAFVTDNGDLDKLTDPGSFIGDTNGVIERGTSSDLNLCVQGLAGAIGPLVANSAPANTTFVAIDGSVPSARPRDSAAVGNYPFIYEQTFLISSLLTDTENLDLAEGMVELSQAQATAPNVNSVVALPNSVNDPHSQGTFLSTIPPIGFGTRSGNSCSDLSPVAP